MRMSLKQILISLVVLSLSLVTPQGTTWATTVEINTLLTNPSFESPSAPGNPPYLCPTSWTCGSTGNPPGFSVYAPTSAQYTPGADGLTNPLVVPHGTQATFSPTSPGHAGQGTLSQVTSTNYIAGNDYTFTFWVGLPNTQVDGSATAGLPATTEVYLTEGGPNGVQDGLPGPFTICDASNTGHACTFPSPAPGHWEQLQITLTAAQLASSGATGQPIGIEFFSSTGQTQLSSNGNGEVVNFDFGAAVPEPTSLLLLGSGLVGFGVWRWKKGQA